jgi:hypothetical protein
MQSGPATQESACRLLAIILRRRESARERRARVRRQNEGKVARRMRSAHNRADCATRPTRRRIATRASWGPCTRMCRGCYRPHRPKRRTACPLLPRHRGSRAALSCGDIFPTSGARPKSARRNLRAAQSDVRWRCSRAKLGLAGTKLRWADTPTQCVAALPPADDVDIRAGHFIRRRFGRPQGGRGRREPRRLRARPARPEVPKEPVLRCKAFPAHHAGVLARHEAPSTPALAPQLSAVPHDSSVQVLI